ncbi:MAG: hypothetical protein JRI55_04870, partial [Deltaproteobacteria bacterium]|nr:hypothetical protein [Deltaproteobacteria bacterium]
MNGTTRRRRRAIIVVAVTAVAAGLVTLIVLRPWSRERGTAADEIPDWLTKDRCSGDVEVERQICARCARRRTTTDRCSDTGPEVGYAPTLLWQEVGRSEGAACEHEWVRTGATSYDKEGGHGHRHVSTDTESIWMLSESPHAVQGLRQYAAAHGTSALEVFRKL